MADEPPKDLPIALTQYTTPVPQSSWQVGPPGPDGAAVDPPPCVQPATAVGALATTPTARARMPDEAAPFPPLRTADQWGAMFRIGPWPHSPRAAGRAAPDDQKVVEPVMLGTETPMAEMEKLAIASGWNPNAEAPKENSR